MNNGIFSSFDRQNYSDTKLGYNPSGLIQYEAMVNSLPTSSFNYNSNINGIYHIPPANDWRVNRTRLTYLIDTTRGRVDRNTALYISDTDKSFGLFPIGTTAGVGGRVTVDWGDGIIENFERNGFTMIPLMHTYNNHGVYAVQLSWDYGSPPDGYVVWSSTAGVRVDNLLGKCLGILSFDSRATTLYRHIMYYDNCDFVPTALPPSVTSINSMFEGSRGTFKNVELWDTKNVTNMFNTFNGFPGRSTFNQDLSNWNVSNVTTMESMFINNSIFNNGNATGINNWDVSKVTNMAGMFGSTWLPTLFNQPIGSWNVGNVTNMQAMFGTFSDAYGTNGDKVFNQNIGSWNTSKVTDMSWMFFGASSFDNGGDNSINNWNTSACTNMREMFRSATAFNEPIGNWNVSNVTNMLGMFRLATTFNQDISSWNVSKVTDMSSMFNNANAFQGSLSGWNLAGLNANTSLDNFMANKTGANSYSTANYDALLIGWNNNKLLAANGVANWRTDLRPNFGGAKYTAGGAAATARAALVIYGWTITDGGTA